MLIGNAFKARPGLSSLILHGLSLAIRLGFMLAILRWSGSTLLGVFSLLVAIEMVVVYLCGLEFHTFTTRRYARRPNRKMLRLCAASHYQMLLVCTPLAVVAATAVALVMRIDLSATEFTLLGTLVASGMLSNETGRFMVLTDKPVHSVIMTFIRTTCWQPLVLPFLGTDVELTALLSLWTSGSLLGTGWALWIMRDGLGTMARPRLRYLLRGLALSRTYYVTTSATVLQSNLDRFVLQTILGPTAVGIFAFFQTLANTLPALVQAAVVNLWQSKILVAFGQRGQKRIELLSEVVRRCGRMSVTLSALICAAALPLAWLTSHNNYLEWLWILPLLLAAQVIVVWSQPLHLAIYAAHRDKALMWVCLGSLTIALVASVGFVTAFGLPGAVSGPLFGASALWIGRRWLIRYYVTRGKL